MAPLMAQTAAGDSISNGVPLHSIYYIRLSASKPLVFLLVSLRSFYSSLEGALKLKFAPFCSP